MTNPELPSEEEEARRHAEKMAKKKSVRDKIIAGKTEERGLLIIHTGKGKGKTSAAMGMAIRCIGHGLKVGIIQFVKGVWETGERRVLARFPELCVMRAMGEGFTWDTQDLKRDKAAARRAFNTAQGITHSRVAQAF